MDINPENVPSMTALPSGMAEDPDEKSEPEPDLKRGVALPFSYRQEVYRGRPASRCTDYILSARREGGLNSTERLVLPFARPSGNVFPASLI